MGRPKKQPEKPVWYQNKITRNSEYNKENMKQVKIALNKNTDADIIEYLETISNNSGYIKALIREDMAKKTKEE